MRRQPDLGTLTSQAEELHSSLTAMRAKAPGASTLTTAELRLIPYLGTHLTFREIGERLYVSHHTVKTQAIAIYRKLNVTSRNDADFATSPALVVADEQRAAPAIEVRLVQGESFIDAKTRSPQDDDQPAKPPTVQAVARGPHDRDDLLDGRRVGRVAPPLVGRSTTGMKAGRRCGRPATARGINNDRLGHDLPDPDTTGGPTRVRSASHRPLPAAA